MRPGSPRPRPPNRPGGPCTDPVRRSSRRVDPHHHRSGRLADVDRPTAPRADTASGSAGVSAAEPVQRWRLRFARDPVASDAVGRVAMDAWAATLAASGLPAAGLEPGGPGRARFTLGAPLPAIAAGRAELADIWLLARRPAWAIREALEGRMPPGH